MTQFLAIAVLLFAPAAYAVDFPGGAYFNPYDFLRQYPAPVRAKLTPAIQSTVLIGSRATGFLISADGWMITASHVVSDLVIGPTHDCARIPLFLHHTVNESGQKDPNLLRARCEEVRFFDVADDFALLKIKLPGPATSWAPLAHDGEPIQVGDRIHVASHPHARDFEKSRRQISSGELVLKDPANEQLPHFLHLANTDGGSSGAPVFNARGLVVGLHIRGVSAFGQGVPVQVDGTARTVHDFNIAVWMPYLARKYALGSLLQP